MNRLDVLMQVLSKLNPVEIIKTRRNKRQAEMLARMEDLDSLVDQVNFLARCIEELSDNGGKYCG